MISSDQLRLHCQVRQSLEICLLVRGSEGVREIEKIECQGMARLSMPQPEEGMTAFMIQAHQSTMETGPSSLVICGDGRSLEVWMQTATWICSPVGHRKSPNSSQQPGPDTSGDVNQNGSLHALLPRVPRYLKTKTPGAIPKQ